MSERNRRDIFKKRKSKVYKNLVSIGQYGVLTGVALLYVMTAQAVAAD